MNKEEKIAEAIKIASTLTAGQIPRQNAMITMAWRVLMVERRLEEYGVPSPFVTDHVTEKGEKE